MTTDKDVVESPATSVCVVTRDLAIDNVLHEDSLCLTALAQRLSLAGHNITVLWIPLKQPKPEVLERWVAQYQQDYSISVELFEHADQTISNYNSPTHISLGVYSYLKRNAFSAVYIPLEGGLSYYTLLGKETGVYSARCTINVIASTPLEWVLEADRHFVWSLEQIKIAFMEKYCALQADRLICTSEGLLEWLKKNMWELTSICETLPPLSPLEWEKEVGFDKEELARQAPRELLLIASPRFRDGLTLFCDMLDKLDKLITEDLRITAVGGFWKILGEHSGGMLVRRGRRWKFRLRFMHRLSIHQGLLYARASGAVAVIPSFENAGGYCVSECIRLAVPFVATAVGGNVGQIVSASASLVAPDAETIAKAVLAKLKNPVASLARQTEEQKFDKWAKALVKSVARIGVVSKDVTSRRKEKRETAPAPLVSVIMTHHDRPQYFMQALASIKEQDYPNFEVILVDDGSRLPESQAMLDGLEDEFNRRKWKIIRTKNRYVGAARNTGVRASRGKFIVFVDDDNALLPNAVSTFVSAIETSGSDVCNALARNFYGSHVPGSSRFNYVGHLPLGASPEIGFFENCFGDTISIYRRTVFDVIGYQLEKFGYMVEDWEFFVRVILAGLKLRLIPEPLFWYRVSTQGRYRSSHFYDNHTFILEAFAKAKFKGIDTLYKLLLGQNIDHYVKESYKINLRYSPSDRDFLELTDLEPNSPEAILLLAKIAANESRQDTAVGLLSSLGTNELKEKWGKILEEETPSLTAVRTASAVFSSKKVLEAGELLSMETASEISSVTNPLSYVEKPGQLFLESISGAISLAVLPAGVPVSAIAVVSQISSQGPETEEMEFLILLCPMHDDPMVAALSAGHEQSEGSSGWVAAGSSGVPYYLEARLSVPSAVPLNLVTAIRGLDSKPKSLLGCFAATTIEVALEHLSTRRPRLGAPPQRLRARVWMNIERMRAVLQTDYPSALPLLLFPKEIEGGIFLRPSTRGPVVAGIYKGFPAFARRLRAQVEIAHDDASPFEFAVALTLPDAELTWRALGPKNPVAFSGWVKVEHNFKLHDIDVKLLEQMPYALTISLAVRLPRGSTPNPANTFFRNLKFFWDD